MSWKWIPTKPLALNTALPGTVATDFETFRALRIPESERPAFLFSFPQLARQTPNLHFYRLIQLFNTPLLCLDSKDMGHHDFAYWKGVRPKVQMRNNYLYFWFFSDQNDDDLIVVEYGFDGGLTLRSEKKPAAKLQAFYQEICQRVELF